MLLVQLQTPNPTHHTDLTIDRRFWWRGKGGMDSKLRRLDGNQCCLGFYAKKLGFNDEQLNVAYFGRELFTLMEGDSPATRIRVAGGDGQSSWLELPAYQHLGSRLLLSTETRRSIGGYLADVNDNGTITDEVREAVIKDVFLTYGNVRVTFVN